MLITHHTFGIRFDEQTLSAIHSDLKSASDQRSCSAACASAQVQIPPSPPMQKILLPFICRGKQDFFLKSGWCPHLREIRRGPEHLKRCPGPLVTDPPKRPSHGRRAVPITESSPSISLGGLTKWSTPFDRIVSPEIPPPEDCGIIHAVRPATK